ncbi:MAG: peptidoglycan editing factor PgeF [bacterium]|nr:peptidoglycan editing factor PgeF [bacterium]
MNSTVELKENKNIFTIATPYPELTLGIVARFGNDINYSRELPPIRNDEKNLLQSLTRLEEKDILFLNQVHEDTIMTLNSPPETSEIYVGDADAVITAVPGLCLVIRTADCVPVFVYDTAGKILGAAHSGWKGTMLEITRKMVVKMNREFGSEYNNMRVFIFPSIGPESYEVSHDVARYFKNDAVPRGEKFMLNLWQNIENSLIKEGIPEENIYNPKICNLANKERFFSHRHGDLGRNLNFAYI